MIDGDEVGWRARCQYSGSGRARRLAAIGVGEREEFGRSPRSELNAHVDAEDRARDGSDVVSIRLATEFYILLANMTNSPILARYVSEVAYRCCLTLSLYSRPHSSECAIIAALVKGDEAKVMTLMHSHLDSVATRAGGPRPAARPRSAGYFGGRRRAW